MVEPCGRARPAGGGAGGVRGRERPLWDAVAVDLTYAPQPDGRPDPGEIVWTWVPYEDDPAQGKDRPVLVVGRDGERLVGLMLTSQDHDRDAAQEEAAGRHWLDVGAGDWDAQRRPSEVRLDRLLDLDPTAVRREGAVLDEARFDAVVAAARALLPELDARRA